ncbi:MAG: hypothetical protein KJN79_09345 [Gammaproteobacteria bacterium]|nr:hypothetical protein [Gammaproteobacteria bacterium]
MFTPKTTMALAAITIGALALSVSLAEAAPTSQPSLSEPETAAQAAETGKQAIHAAKSGLWWNFSALVIMLAMFAGKSLGLLKRMGRWKYVCVPVLSLAASLLAAFQGGVSFEVAVSVLTTGMATAKLQELWEHGIRGKPHGLSSGGRIKL